MSKESGEEAKGEGGRCRSSEMKGVRLKVMGRVGDGGFVVRERE